MACCNGYFYGLVAKRTGKEIMPYLHCSNCHHEYEAIDENETCNWCGSHGYVLEKETPLESLLKEISEMKIERIVLYIVCDCGCKFMISTFKGNRPKGVCPDCGKKLIVAGKV